MSSFNFFSGMPLPDSTAVTGDVYLLFTAAEEIFFSGAEVIALAVSTQSSAWEREDNFVQIGLVLGESGDFVIKIRGGSRERREVGCDGREEKETLFLILGRYIFKANLTFDR